MSLKQLKEAHVSNLTGTAVSELNVLLLVMPAATLALSLVDPYIAPRGLPWFGLQFGLTVLPMIGAFTCGGDLMVQCLVLLVAAAIAILRPSAPPGPTTRRPGWLTLYRGWTMLSTCVCILAVDFHIFPRRFGKTETFGTGLMDLGVGAFVFNAGFTSRSCKPLRTRLRAAAPMVLLGLVRLATVKGADYQEHVTEYGVHWNFFFTLAAINLVGPMIPQEHCLAGAVAVGLGHQVALGAGVQSWVLGDDRQSLLAMNKEGVSTLTGYCALFVLAKGIGRQILGSNTLHSQLQGLGCWAAGLWAFHTVATHVSLFAVRCFLFDTCSAGGRLNLSSARQPSIH